MTCKSPFRIHSATHFNLQSQWRKRPPSESPRRVLFKCAKAFSGTVGNGLPSSASKVTAGLPRKAVSGNDVRRLNPMSNTRSSFSEWTAPTGNSDRRLFSKLKELKVFLTPWKAVSPKDEIKFLSKLSALSESNPSNVLTPPAPGSSRIPFNDKSKKAKVFNPRTASGTRFCFVPFRFRFFRQFSKPRSENLANVTLLSISFNVDSFNRDLNESFGIWLILFFDKSSRLSLANGLSAFTGTSSRRLSWRLRFFRCNSCPKKAFSSICFSLQLLNCTLCSCRLLKTLFSSFFIVELLI